MLVSITFENFTSFKEEATIDFSATKYTILQNTNVNNEKILKGALFIGPNASGKTNVLLAIKFLLSTLKDDKTNYSMYRCLFSKEPLMHIEYTFRFEGSIVKYAISYDEKNNTLAELLTLDGKMILKRIGLKGELHLSENPIIDDYLDKDTTFLRTAAFNTGRFPQIPALRAMINYIQNSRYIDGSHISAFLGENVEEYLENEGTEKYNKYLSWFKYDFFTEYGNKSSGEGATLNFGDEKRAIIKRNSFQFPIPIQLESQGNKVFLDILACLIPVIEEPGIIIVDEFGNSLHNNLAEIIVSFFMKRSESSQLFITSHCTNLVSNSVFRPDQIYTITFDGKNGSKVRRVSEFKPREAQNLEKMYLGGMFEGLPKYE